MGVVIHKYGGSSVSSIEKIERVAERVVAAKDSGKDVVVVVSAMGHSTDDLLRMACEIVANPPARELDMLLSTGERTTMALLSIAIQKRGKSAISFTGSQSGIITNDSHSNAKIIAVRPYRIQDELARGQIVIVAGYQGTSYKNEITTLGRGGSDMTAVALAGALEAESCEIYSDVDGVYTGDPKVILDAQKLSSLSASEMLALSKHGAKVLHDEAVSYARAHGISLYAKASHMVNSEGTVIRPDNWPGYALESLKVRGVSIASAKSVLYLCCECRDYDVFESWYCLHGSTIRLIGASMDGSHYHFIYDSWNCVDMGGLKLSFYNNAWVGEVQFIDSYRNVSVIGKEIGQNIEIISKAIKVLASGGVKVAYFMSDLHSLMFLVDNESIVESSRLLHEALIVPQL